MSFRAIEPVGFPKVDLGCVSLGDPNKNGGSPFQVSRESRRNGYPFRHFSMSLPTRVQRVAHTRLSRQPVQAQETLEGFGGQKKGRCAKWAMGQVAVAQKSGAYPQLFAFEPHP